MKVDPECYPCLLGRALAIARRATNDPWLQHRVIGSALEELKSIDRDSTPAEAVGRIFAQVTKTLGTSDPFADERAKWWLELESALDTFREAIDSASDSLEAAVLLAGIANVFDDERLPAASVREVLDKARDQLKEPDVLAASDFGRFSKKIGRAAKLVMLHDSGPELPFDKMLLKEVLAVNPLLSVTSVVHADPVLLDATQGEVETVELSGLPAHVLALQTKDVGFPAGECGTEIQTALDEADVILAKGQAHYETLGDGDKRIFYLMRVKCPVMARLQGVQVGDVLFVRASP